MRKVLLLFIFVLSAKSLIANPFYNVVDHGAKGDGQQVNTKFIQNAIDECAAKGGGTITSRYRKY